MSDACTKEKRTAGMIYDASTGEELADVELQLVGSHPGRIFYKPDADKDTDAFMALMSEYPELKKVSSNRICESANGFRSTEGYYMGQVCAVCEHSSRCSERMVAMYHRTGEGEEAMAREMPINWASQGAFTRMLTRGALAKVPPWYYVYRVEGDLKANTKGQSTVLKVAGVRPATDAEIAEAEAVIAAQVGPITHLLMEGTPMQPMLIGSQAEGPRALPALRHDAEDASAQGDRAVADTPPRAKVLGRELGDLTPDPSPLTERGDHVETPTQPTNGGARPRPRPRVPIGAQGGPSSQPAGLAQGER
jgi:hypothetical protein